MALPDGGDEAGPSPSWPPAPAGLMAPAASLPAVAANLSSIKDTNMLQTALAAAIAAEDFQLAAAVRDRLKEVMGAGGARIDWTSIPGMPEWLTDRAQRLGFRFPTEVQRRACGVISSGSDAVVASETGSGKTLSYLMPTLARLTYPPDIFLEDLKGPAALIIVPTLELGAQVALAAYRLFGGSITSPAQARPGDDSNMYTYTGPKAIKVRGILNKEEVVMAKQSLTYLSQVHVVVATPATIMEAVLEPSPLRGLVEHLQVLVVDEVDECFTQAPDQMAALLEAACTPPLAASAAAPQPASAAPPQPSSGASRQAGAAWRKPQVVFVGATQRPEVVALSEGLGWVVEPVHVQVGQAGAMPAGLRHRYVVVDSARRLAALVRSLRRDVQELGPDSAPARVVLFANTGEEVAAMTDPLVAALWTDHRLTVLLPPGTLVKKHQSSNGGEPAQRPEASPSGRGVEAGAQGGPSGDDDDDDDMEGMFAYDPLRALQLFRDHRATLLLASGQAARGLDLPAVSHVYNIGLPPDTTQYLHRAGRAGRIGSMIGGTVTTVVSPEELPGLMALASALGITIEEQPEALPEGLPQLALPAEDEGGDGAEGSAGGKQGAGGAAALPALGDVDRARKGLEDLFNLM